MIKIKKSKNGGFYFTVVARNGNVLLTSKTYTEKRYALRAIASVYKATETARIEDLAA